MHAPYNFYRTNLSCHCANCKRAEGCPYPNLLNLVSFNELDRTNQESTRINGLTGHQQLTYKVFSHNFVPGCVNLLYKALSSLFNWSLNKMLHIT